MTIKLVKERKPKSDGRIVVNVSFTESEYPLLNHADEHGNFSQYIKRLIVADMKQQEQQQPQQQPDAMALLMGLIQSGQIQINPGMFQQQTQQFQQVQPMAQVQVQEEPKLMADRGAVGKILGKKI